MNDLLVSASRYRCGHLLVLCAVFFCSNAGRYDDNNEGHPITSGKQVKGPDCGIEDLNHHAVQLHSFQEHPRKDSQEEEMEHGRHEPAAALWETRRKNLNTSANLSKTRL